MMRQNLSIRRLLMIAALLLAIPASADSYFYLDDVLITPADNGKTITLPVKAHFDKPVSSWDVQFTFPEGLTPIRVVRGSDMTFTYTEYNGQERQMFFDISHDQDLTRFASCTYGWHSYVYDEEEEDYLPLNLVKWEAGTYDEMFLITFNIGDIFQTEEIQVYTQTSCGFDNDPTSGITFDPSPIIEAADINSDAVINISDVSAFLDFLTNGHLYYLRDIEEEEPHLLLGDVNADGFINILDLNEICDYLWTAEWYHGYELNEAYTSSRIVNNEPTYVCLYIDPLEISASDLGNDITIPVKAEFSGYNSSWDMQITLPQGVTIVGYAPGRDMTLNYLDDDGNERSALASLAFSDDYTHFVAKSLIADYRPAEDGSFEFCGTAKWEPGTYNEMLLLTIHVEPEFEWSEIIINSSSSCGKDIRNESLIFCPGEVPHYENEWLVGDINGDGTITINDIIQLMNYFVDKIDYNPHLNTMDLNCDEVIDLQDLEKLCDLIFFGEWYDGYVLNEGEIYYTWIAINYPPLIPGDVNGDNTLNISDVTSLINLLLNGGNMPETADVNGDGLVNIQDVTALINMLLNGN